MNIDGKISCDICWEPLNYTPMEESELEKEMKEQGWIEMPFHARMAHICRNCFEKKGGQK